jgi:hypothetical protein
MAPELVEPWQSIPPLWGTPVMCTVQAWLRTVLLAGLAGGAIVGCAVSRPPAQTVAPAQQLQTIILPKEKLSGSPKQLIARLNKLSRKYDTANHQGVHIVFDPAVDSECCLILGISCPGEPLGKWIQEVCGPCGARYRVEADRVVIELLPLSERQTPDLESHLTNGMVELCRQFRARRGQERFALGEQIFHLLPQSPITSRKEVPGHLYLSYDSDHPSYKLYKKDVVQLLGEPDRNINNETFCYSLRPKGKRVAELYFEFGKYDYAINPGLHWR